MSPPTINRPQTTSRFVVLDGIHADENGKTYRRGDTVESTMPLDRMYNVPGYPPKFQRNHEHEKQQAVAQIAAVPEGAFVFDPSKESFEQFQERVKAHAPATSTPVAVPTSPNPPTTPRNLEAMSDADLRKLADAEEVDLKGAKSKADMIKALRAAGH